MALGPPPTWDETGDGPYGRVVAEPQARYRPGDRVEVAFVGAHLANDLRRGGTFLEVQHEDGDGWRTVADDGDWATTLRWHRVGRHGSRVTVTWQVPPDARPGRHRVLVHGTARDRAGAHTTFTGVTRGFAVELG